MTKLRVLDLFSGIGGFSKGLEDTGGFETVRFCEMKPHARAVLAKNFGPVPCDEDVTLMEFKEGEADVITAGFPCQDISFAGDGAGLAGSRSGLYREVIRAIRVVRPLRAVLENVAALLSRGLGTVLGDLATVGYDAEWHCIPASAVGAPHRRDRIWIVADARSEQHEGGSTPLSGALAAQLSRSAEENEVGYASSAACERDSRAVSGAEKEVGREDREVDGDHSVGPEYAGAGRASGQWIVEPDVGRVAHGVSFRVDRLAELGNAVVPQIPEIIGRAILNSLAA